MREGRVNGNALAIRDEEHSYNGPMHLRAFEAVVTDALDALPPVLQGLLENVEVVARLFPTREQLQENGLANKYDLLGLYEGIPLTERGSNYSLVLPDRVTLFKEPIEALCHSTEEMSEQIRRTVKHELAHHFGIKGQDRFTLLD